MILIHRISPFVLAIMLSLGMYVIVFTSVQPVATAVAMIVCSLLLFGRLLQFEVRTFQFWNFVLTPVLFLVASLGMIFFLEQPSVIMMIAGLAVALILLYAEYVFQYIHLPATYQPYSLEYLSLFLNLLTVFFLSAVGFGLILLVQISLGIVSLFALFCFVFVIYGTFWVSKAHESKIKPYTLGGSILMTELFIAISFLPTSYFTSAALMTVLFYLFIGLTRAHVLRTLSTPIIKHYLITSSVLLLAILLSSQWL